MNVRGKRQWCGDAIGCYKVYVDMCGREESVGVVCCRSWFGGTMCVRCAASLVLVLLPYAVDAQGVKVALCGYCRELMPVFWGNEIDEFQGFVEGPKLKQRKVKGPTSMSLARCMWAVSQR